MKKCVLFAALIASFTLATPAMAQFKNAEDSIKYRKAAFTVMGQHFGQIGAMVSGRVPFDAQKVKDDAALVRSSHPMRLLLVMRSKATHLKGTHSPTRVALPLQALSWAAWLAWQRAMPCLKLWRGIITLLCRPLRGHRLRLTAAATCRLTLQPSQTSARSMRVLAVIGTVQMLPVAAATTTAGNCSLAVGLQRFRDDILCELHGCFVRRRHRTAR